MEALESLIVDESTVIESCGEPPIPALGIIEQRWETHPIPQHEIGDHIGKAIDALDFQGVPAGGEIAIGVGSRGIANLATMVRATVEHLEDRGYSPVIVPAMGSHGGATATGQRQMLATLGVTPESASCEIRPKMDTVTVGSAREGEVPVVTAETAVAADGILLLNRIKPHTDFDGEIESGLAKMLVIGLGKQQGAKIAHNWAIDWSLRNMIPDLTDQLLAELPVIGGIAIIEDQHHDTAIIEGVRASEFLDRERDLLRTAYGYLPRLPFDEVDILILDQQGKDISGQGMDTNVIGRRPFAINESPPSIPDIKRIYVRSLTEATHGNAMGVGSADIIHRDILSSLEARDTFINAITASTIGGIQLPPVLETDRAALITLLSSIGIVNPETVRILRATDTMRLDRLYASTALIKRAKNRDDLAIIKEPEPQSFDELGAFDTPTPTRR